MITKGSTVKAHTGSTKRGNYRVISGTVVDFDSRSLGPSHCVLLYVIKDAAGELHREPKSRITEVEAPAPVAAPKPRSIRFETAECRRCEGERRNPAWGKVGGGWCFRCDGVGTLLTEAGKEADAAYERMRDERLGARYADIAEGETYKRNGKFFIKGEGAWVHPDSRVHRHNGAITRQIWAEVAAQYPGATLVY